MTIHSLHQELLAVAQDRTRLEKLRRQEAQVEKEHQQASAEADALFQALEREEQDVRRLEGISLTALLASLTGRREAKLDQERQEAEAARLKYEAARQREEQLAAELERIRSEADSLEGVEETYARLLAEKERLMLQTENHGAKKLLQLAELEQKQSFREREIEDARRAGMEADAALRDVEASLESADSWSTWDLFGGGWLSTAMKHSHLDEAQARIYRAQEALARFHRELRDVHSEVAPLPRVDLGGFARFADYFFDGLLVDIGVQRHINQSLSSVRSARLRVDELLQWLDRQAETLEAQREELRRQRQWIIETYHP